MDNRLASDSLDLASSLWEKKQAFVSDSERLIQKKRSALVGSAFSKQWIIKWLDQAFRASSAKKNSQCINELIDGGIPDFFSAKEKKLLKILRKWGWMSPTFAIRQVKKHLIKEFDDVLVVGNFQALFHRISTQKEAGFVTVVNVMGESVLGEDEAARRLKQYLDLLQQPQVTHLAVKTSAIFSQSNAVNFEGSVAETASRLAVLFQQLSDDKTITLDMESYSDLFITVEAFKRAAQQFPSCRLGLAIQAYIPDSFAVVQGLLDWAKQRVNSGGKPIRIRLVKGANLGMEAYESSLHNWTSPIFESKTETDAHYKKLLRFLIHPDVVPFIELGVASHNVFDVAYALVLKKSHAITTGVCFEMLAGMAPSFATAVHSLGEDVLLYTPFVSETDFFSATAYLVRRLDEVSGKGHFLKSAFDLTTGSEQWEAESQHFSQALELSFFLESTPKRGPKPSSLPFSHEPETDWVSGPQKKFLPDFSGQTPFQNLLGLLRFHRQDLIALMADEVSKPRLDADAEVSEAIDFVIYYGIQHQSWVDDPYVVLNPLGTVLVASPWNFPLAIPLGGIIAALYAGNTVLFKPAPEAVRIGTYLAELLWKAGFNREQLQLLCIPDEPDGTDLIKRSDLSAVVLTGGTQTASYFLSLNPALNLMAETGGKNAIIVTALSDRDAAIKDVIQSAFGYAGQKCSAASLLICEREVFNDPHFKQQLVDAAKSLVVGPAADPQTSVPPLIKPPSGHLLQALTTCKGDEEWALQPQKLDETTWTPGIKWYVQPHEFTHTTEFFGPVLAVMCAENLEDAIKLANATPYGLTSGLHSLSEEEHFHWMMEIKAGTLYINRGITGAVVGRQPFGGMKASSVGRGLKAGGDAYLRGFFHPEMAKLPQEIPNYMSDDCKKLSDLFLPILKPELHETWLAALNSYVYWGLQYRQLKQSDDVVYGQYNLNYRLPHSQVLFRVDTTQCPPLDVALTIAAAVASLSPLTISYSSLMSPLVHALLKNPMPCITILQQTDAELKQWLYHHKDVTRIRCLAKPSDDFLNMIHSRMVTACWDPVYPYGRIEMLHYLREVSVSHNYHRYGSVANY